MDSTNIIVACIGIVSAAVPATIALVHPEQGRRRVQSDLEILLAMTKVGTPEVLQAEMEAQLAEDIKTIRKPNWWLIASVSGGVIGGVILVGTVALASIEGTPQEYLHPQVARVAIGVSFYEYALLILWLASTWTKARALGRTRNI